MHAWQEGSEIRRSQFALFHGLHREMLLFLVTMFPEESDGDRILQISDIHAQNLKLKY